MFILLNITKWASFTEHYYGKLYILHSYIDLNDVYNGKYDKKLSNTPNIINMEKEYGFIIEKSLDEKELIENAFVEVKKYWDQELWIVFYEGKFSKSHTEYLQNIIHEYRQTEMNKNISK